DHCGEGIYAEIFTATLEAAAFVVGDLSELIKIGLSRIPADCRVARSVKLVCEHHGRGSDFLAVREAVVKDSEDLGWFQAPANIGFVIIGLLYGNGDFGRSICLATNCGDDTDCTAATVGAILGIILGRSGLPRKWIEPIGEGIQTCAINTGRQSNLPAFPVTIRELAGRVTRLAVAAQRENPTLPQLASAPTAITGDYLAGLANPEPVIKRVWNRSPYELSFELPFGRFSVDYDQGPEICPGESKKLTLKMGHVRFAEKAVNFKLMLPEGWRAAPSAEFSLLVEQIGIAAVEVTVMPGEFAGAYHYLPVEIRLCDRTHPTVVCIPLQRRGSVNLNSTLVCQDYYDAANRCKSQTVAPVLV
ncbi:MAG: ADP-ribosylglycohydrolase family protein, partial [Lentisphaeria bacterium]